MTPPSHERHEERVLVLTPTGADADVACDLLRKAGINAESCRDMDDLLARLGAGAGCLFVAQEALKPASIDRLNHALRSQEPWSDIPVILLSTRRLGAEAETGILQTLGEVGNILLVERPCRAGTLISITSTALRARRRQYAARQLLDERAKARDVAEQANLAKDRFLATLSHELRTPLTPVLATAGLLSEDKRLPPDIREDLDVIQRNIELEARLIDDLLDLTRVTTGKLQLNLENVDVHQLIRRVYDICCTDIRAKNICVDFQLHAETPFVHADAARLHQMIWNLLKNAAKFTPEGGMISIITRNETSSGAMENGNVSDRPAGRNGHAPPPAIPRTIIEVRDNGIGIDPAQLPKLFTAFEQGSQDVTRQFGGLGLGLAITKALADAHEGQVIAHSDGPGKGATFTLVLPGATKPPKSAATPPQRPAQARPLAILLVEDHADTARVMQRMLLRWGHTVTVAQSVKQALEASSRQQHDLIISDIGLPDGSGLDFVKTLREQAATPAIALTGYGMEEDVRRCLASGFQAHITKPVNFSKLEAAIAELTAAPAVPQNAAAK
jgi:signal transduction histidine kinase/ActR/RegA family two-component response regulator